MSDEQYASLRRLLAERDALEEQNASLRNRLGDNLCHLENPETDPIPPKPEFLESCSRFWEQRASESGVLVGCKTIAQLEEELEQLRTALKTSKVEGAREILLSAIHNLKYKAPPEGVDIFPVDYDKVENWLLYLIAKL